MCRLQLPLLRTVVTSSVTSPSPVPEQTGNVSPRPQVSPVPSTIPKQYPEPNLEEILIDLNNTGRSRLFLLLLSISCPLQNPWKATALLVGTQKPLTWVW